jgi:hypothetical protein
VAFPGLTCGAAEFQMTSLLLGGEVRNVLTILTPIRRLYQMLLLSDTLKLGDGENASSDKQESAHPEM